MLCGVYQDSGIRLRNHRRAEPPRDIEPVGDLRTVGRSDRARASDVAADGVKAPARAARSRLRRSHSGRPAASLSAQARTASGSGRLAGAVSAVLVLSRGCARTPSRSHASPDTKESKDKEKTVTARERYAPGPASAQVEKHGEQWTLVLVRELRHSPEKVWQALTDPAQLR